MSDVGGTAGSDGPVNAAVERLCRKYEFTLYKYSNNFNHLHILIRVTNRHRWRGFIRELTRKIASLVRLATGHAGRLWLDRTFTRIIKGWGLNFQRVKEYIALNILGAADNLTREQARVLQRLKMTCYVA